MLLSNAQERVFVRTYWLTGKDGYRFTVEKDVCVFIPKKVKLERVVVMKAPQTAGDQRQEINIAGWSLDTASTLAYGAYMWTINGSIHRKHLRSASALLLHCRCLSVIHTGLELSGGGGELPLFMSTNAHFLVKIGFKCQSLGKISNISTSDPQFF